MKQDSQSKTQQIILQADGSWRFESAIGLEFLHGGHLRPLTLVYETIGHMNPEQDNIILINHALSTGSHVCSHEQNTTPGWWEAMVGPGKAIDTNRYFVICINNLGSCYGSSGPASINPETQKFYQCDFPLLTITDMVRSQYLLLEHLGIKKLYAVIGNSMGAMLSLTWAILYPTMVQRLISVSSCYKSYPMSVATHQLQREMIELDPHWNNGYYEKQPTQGFLLARKFGLLSYRNPAELSARFTEAGSLESYLEYNAQKFVQRFDANCYIYLQAAMDMFDVTAGYDDRLTPFRGIQANTLVISVSSDMLFPPQQQQELYQMLKDANVRATMVMHDSNFGHDAFYADPTINAHIKAFLAK